MTDAIRNYLWVALGSTVGGVLRFWISGMVAERLGQVFPWNTLAVNVTGSFIIGVFGAFTLPEAGLTAPARSFISHFLMVGICGGYTTFSSFSLQTLQLLQKNEWWYASLNVLVSVVSCLIAVWLGYIAGQTLHRS